MRRIVSVGAVFVCLLQGTSIVGGQQPLPHQWGSEYVLNYFSFVPQGDVAADVQTFTPSWIFRIFNSPDGPLSNPTITVTTPLFGTMTPLPWSGTRVTEDPANQAYVWTRIDGLLPPATGQANEHLQADLASTVPVSYPLGYTFARALEGGQWIAANETVTRSFSLTLTLEESAREFGGAIDIPVGPGSSAIVVSGFESCSSTEGEVRQSSDPSRPGVSWSAVAAGGSYSIGQTFTLSCELELTNTTTGPRLFTPAASMNVGQFLLDYGYRETGDVLIYSSEVAPPLDPLGGAARFQVTEPDGRPLSGLSGVRFFRRVVLGAVDQSTDTAPPTTTAVLSPAPSNPPWNNTSPVTVTLHATDNLGGSGVREITYWVTTPGPPPPEPPPPTTVMGDTCTVDVTASGSATVNYYARDNAGNAESRKFVVVMIDALAPVTNANTSPGPTGTNVFLSAFDPCLQGPCSGVRQISYALSGAQNQPLTTVSTPSTSFAITAVGSTTVTYYAEDRAGNREATRTLTVTVIDTTPPVIAAVTASPGQLWPPNHKLVPIALGVTVSDNVTAAPACRVASVTSNEPLNGSGDGNTTADWTFSGVGLDLSLRAERSGNLIDRIYTVAIVCSDAAGNDSQPKTIAVVVPHDQGKR